MELLETIKQLDAKQKMTGVITLLLLAFLIYFAYDTFANGGASTPPPQKKSAAKSTSASDRSSDLAESSVQEHSLPQQPGSNHAAIMDPVSRYSMDPRSGQDEVMKQPLKQPDPEQLAFLEQTKQMQQEYLRLVNEFQLAQLQGKLEQAKAQISDARLKSLLSLAKQEQLKTELEKEGQSIVGPSIGGGAQTDLQVSYVGQRRGQWSAMLNEGTAYFEVHVGTRLGDGWRVTRIGSQGVILQRGEDKKLLRMPKTLG